MLNRMLSFGIDKYWRKKLIKSMNIRNGQHILDIATGTGDVAFSINKKYDVTIIGVDISKKMLEVAQTKLDKIKATNTKIEFLHGDAENLPMGDNSYDHICISFGFRNLGNYDQALKEFHRVLKPGGRIMVLEFSHIPNDLLQWFYDKYSFNVIPRLGQIIASDRSSYQYLVESIRKFPKQESFMKLVNAAGFENTKYRNLTMGVACLHSGWKI